MSPDPRPANADDNLADCPLSNGEQGGGPGRRGLKLEPGEYREETTGWDRIARLNTSHLAPEPYLDRNLDARPALVGWLRALLVSCDEGAQGNVGTAGTSRRRAALDFGCSF